MKTGSDAVPPRRLRGVQLERYLSGRCVWCGAVKDEEGTRWYCRPCANKQTAHAKRARDSYIAQGICIDCKTMPVSVSVRCEECSTVGTKRRSSIDKRLRREYGIGLSQYEAMLTAQEGVCAICRKAETIKSRLSVDHCHTTGKIRGLLCSKCNAGIGHLGDSIEVIENALAYLRASVPMGAVC